MIEKDNYTIISSLHFYNLIVFKMYYLKLMFNSHEFICAYKHSSQNLYCKNRENRLEIMVKDNYTINFSLYVCSLTVCKTYYSKFVFSFYKLSLQKYFSQIYAGRGKKHLEMVEKSLGKDNKLYFNCIIAQNMDFVITNVYKYFN